MVFIFWLSCNHLVWPEPKSFQADRFLGTDSTTTKVNPWPTLGYAMPLGTIDDKKNYNSHCCVMARLNNRVVEAFIKMLADPSFPRYDLDLKIDEASKKNMYSRKQAETIAFHKKWLVHATISGVSWTWCSTCSAQFRIILDFATLNSSAQKLPVHVRVCPVNLSIRSL